MKLRLYALLFCLFCLAVPAFGNEEIADLSHELGDPQIIAQIVVITRASVTDYQGLSSTPGNPSTGFGRVYFNSSTNQLTCNTSTGGNCLSAGGGGNVTGTSLTSGDVITGAGGSAIQDSGTALTALAPLASPTFTVALTVPIGASYSPTANGSIGYDSSANQYSVGINGSNARLLAGTPTGNTTQFATWGGGATTAARCVDTDTLGNLQIVAGDCVSHSVGPLVSGNIVIGNGTGDLKTDTGCSTDGAGNATCTSFTTTNDGIHAGRATLVGNTTLPSLPANTFSWIGPATASPTAYGFQVPNAGPGSAGIMHIGALSSAVSQATVSLIVAADITANTITGAQMTNATVTATQLAAQYSKGSCTEVWGGSGAAFALTSGDDAVSNNSCYNDSGVTRTITAVKCRSDNGSNTTTVNPTFGSAGTGTTILSGALTCGNSYAYSSSGTVSNASWTTGAGIDPAMAGTLTGTSIAMIVEYTY
jgi:hypothetical protein